MRLMATYYVYNVIYSGDSNIAPYYEDHKVQYVSCVIGVQDTVHAPYQLRVRHWNNNRRCE